MSPNRFNLRFCVKKVKKDIQLKELKWLVDLILEQKMNCLKAIVFYNSMNEIALVVNYYLILPMDCPCMVHLNQTLI